MRKWEYKKCWIVCVPRGNGGGLRFEKVWESMTDDRGKSTLVFVMCEMDIRGLMGISRGSFNFAEPGGRAVHADILSEVDGDYEIVRRFI